MAMPRAGPSTGWPRYVTLPAVGVPSPAMSRSSVDLPEPERPRSPTISPSLMRRLTPSSTSSSAPSAFEKDLRTPCTSRSGTAFMSSLPSSEAETPLSVEVERPPEESIDRNDEQTHRRDAEHDAMEIARRRSLGDVRAEPVRFDVRIAPARELRNDGGIPGAARCGD